MSKYTVAVIIAYYNGSKWIERAIKSVLNQSIAPAEFFIVNDGSRDEEYEFLKNLAQKYKFIIINKENGGQGSARNSGAYASRSDFLCFLDQDDYFLHNHIEILISNIPSDFINLGFVYGDCKEADAEGRIISNSIIHRDSIHPKESVVDYLKYDMFILPSASLISRAAYNSVSGFDEQFRGYEDDDLFIRLYRKGFDVVFVNKPVLVWCINGESTSYSIHMSRSRFKYFLKISKEFGDRVDRNLFFLRDYLIPRFEPSFSHDVLKYKDTEYEEEVLNIFDEYINFITKNKYVSYSTKLRAKIFRFALPLIPKKIHRYISYIGRLFFR